MTAEAVELDTYRFNRVLEELQSYTGADFKTIIRYEANRMLSTAMENTKAGTASYIDQRYTYSDKKKPHKRLVPFVYLNGKKTKVREIKRHGMMVTLKSGKQVWKPNRVNPQWKLMQAKLKELKAKKKARRGMAKASWMYIARRAKLGKLSKTKPYIQKALGLMTSNMKAKLNAKDVGKTKFILEIRNMATLPMIPNRGRRKGPGGFTAFKDAFHGRSQYFFVNLSKGVFKKAKRIESKYKGFQIEPLKNTSQSD